MKVETGAFPALSPKFDVFIRTSARNNYMRGMMFQASEARWLYEPVTVHRVVDMSITEGRQWAENLSRSDPYIFTDDDVLILGKDWVQRAVGILLRNPDYAIASTLSMVEGENMAKGQGEIYPMHAVGQPMLIRKGVLGTLPEINFTYECQVLQQIVESKGFKMGILDNSLRHNHIGHGFSGTEVLRWGY